MTTHGQDAGRLLDIEQMRGVANDWHWNGKGDVPGVVVLEWLSLQDAKSRDDLLKELAALATASREFEQIVLLSTQLGLRDLDAGKFITLEQLKAALATRDQGTEPAQPKSEKGETT